MRRPRTKKGKYGTLYLYRIAYRDLDPACPRFTTKLWAYNREHAEERFFDPCDPDWKILSIERVNEDPHRFVREVRA